jgi:sporadic carbohydrate cluster 2OG-Fe(II) oxygenase
VWDGDSPFEVVAWLPLVDCYRTKSMYLLHPEKGMRVESEFGRFQGKSEHDLYAAIEPDLKWLTVPFGSVLLFSQNLMHGNVINREPETRWSMNCRFKSLFSPYAGKRLGEFFEPITIRAATRLGMAYNFPDGLHE